MPEYQVPVDELREGDRVRLEMSWMDHPFLLNCFEIKNQAQIQTLKGMGLRSVICIANSPRPPPRRAEAPANRPANDSMPAPAGEGTHSLWEKKKAQIERQQQRRESLQRCEKRFLQTARECKDLLDNFHRAPEESTRRASRLITEVISELLVEEQIVFHLMNTRTESEAVYYHSLNATIMALTLGKEGGLDKDSLRKLGVGSLFHDLGKNRLPKSLLLKGSNLTEAERSYLELHPLFGEQQTEAIAGFPVEARKVIKQHHEKVNGKGYPDGLIGPQISIYAKVLAIANTYDNYCNAPMPRDSLTPYQALAVMFHRQKQEFDETLLALFVRSLGVYPPGTIVQLSNGSVGIVVATNIKSSLTPSVLIHDPEVPPEEALILDLADIPDLKIEKTIRPENLSEEAYTYLSPRKRLVYYVEPASAGMKPAA